MKMISIKKNRENDIFQFHEKNYHIIFLKIYFQNTEHTKWARKCEKVKTKTFANLPQH